MYIKQRDCIKQYEVECQSYSNKILIVDCSLVMVLLLKLESFEEGCSYLSYI